MKSKTNPVDVSAAVSSSTGSPLNTSGFGGGMLLQARDLTIETPEGKKVVSGLSLHVHRQELVVLAGADHATKTALLEVLAGLRRPVKGTVLVDSIELYPYLPVFRSYIGYVPREIALHGNLTVREILDYEARLQMPRGTSSRDRRQWVADLIATIGMQENASRSLDSLSDLEKRLVSVAVELLKKPGLLLVDEPAEDLDPIDQIHLTTLLSSLARRGFTIIQATDLSRCLMLADKIVMLDAQGTLAWYGPPDEALVYFRGFFSNGNGPKDIFTFDDVAEILEKPPEDSKETWADRYRKQPAFMTYIDDPLNDRKPDLLLQSRPLKHVRGAAVEKQPPPKVARSSIFTQLGAMLGRSIRVLARGRAGLVLLLAPLLASLLLFLISSPVMLNPVVGDPNQFPAVLGVMIFLVMLTAALLFQNQIQNENGVYKRENRSVPISLPYALAKALIAGMAALYLGLVFTAMYALSSGLTNISTLLPTWLTLTLIAFLGGMIGLIVSSLTKTPQSAAYWVMLLTVPQFLLSGSVFPLSQLDPPAQMLATGNPARYAFDTLLAVSDYGKSILADPCWVSFDNTRILDDDQKQVCTCMGQNIFTKCDFPGVFKFIMGKEELLQPPPPEPGIENLIPLPAQPALQPGQSAEAYKLNVDNYTLEIEKYNTSVDQYIDELHNFSQTMADWQRLRALIIGDAEGSIAQALEHYGHSLYSYPPTNWTILLAINVSLVILLAVVQRRKGYQK